jgi:cysteinyl-tRNA synthetase
MVKQIMANGYAYEVNGTVYFDVNKYVKEHNYTILTNRNLEDLLNNTRELGGQDEKKGRLDFALWIKAKPEHIMRWPAPWSVGFPGWHIECSAMSRKYLGDQFDIHGGGMDLAATHHTNEIAQSEACNHVQPAKYWMHTNMLTVNGTRMSKSAGNGFLPHELFTGDHPLLNKGYSPMSVRFFMLQAHYRSTLDFSNEALEAAEKGYKRLMAAIGLLDKISPANKTKIDLDLEALRTRCYAAMDDDFNSPVLIAELFELVRLINSIYDGKQQVDQSSLDSIRELMSHFVFDVMGLLDDQVGADHESVDRLMDVIINIRNEAKKNKDFTTSDRIRQELAEIGIQLKDSKDGTLWNKI